MFNCAGFAFFFKRSDPDLTSSLIRIRIFEIGRPICTFLVFPQIDKNILRVLTHVLVDR